MTRAHSSNRTSKRAVVNIEHILRLGELLESCVRSENFDHALNLVEFSSRLRTRHESIPLVKAVLDEVKEARELLISELVRVLGSDVQLPRLLRVVGYLRRLCCFSNEELCERFLYARASFMHNQLRAAVVSTSSTYALLSKRTDVQRVAMFDVITQFRAIFGDDISNGLLYSWVLVEIRAYITLLEEMIPKLTDGSSLANVLDVSMFFGQSLGRLGADFRLLLVPVFENASVELFARGLKEGLRQFETSASRINPRTTLLAADDEESSRLLRCPVLNSLMNQFNNAMTELKACAPETVCKRIGVVATDALEAYDPGRTNSYTTRGDVGSRVHDYFPCG